MSLLYIPDIRRSVLESCEELIRKYKFSVRVRDINKVELISEKCGISIAAAISPIGESQIDIDFYDPRANEKKYYSDFLLFHLDTRAEPKDIMNSCDAEAESFDETVRRSLKCFVDHTLRYRTDILEGDFESWLRKEQSYFTEEIRVYDDERSEYLRSLGISVIRFENCEVFDRRDAVLETIKKMFTTTPRRFQE